MENPRIELLFFDTFSHEANDELNLDLVQFPHPVCVNEVRIIPLGSRVQADFPGGVRLGATNPSSFQLDLFVNDLSKARASNFTKLGSLEYKQNVNIQLNTCSKIPTDGLVLRGWYSTITLAVFGILTNVVKEKSLSPPPPPPPRIQPIVPAATTIVHASHDIVGALETSTANIQIDQNWHLTQQTIPEVPTEASYIEPQSLSYPVDNTYSHVSTAYVHPTVTYTEQSTDFHPPPAAEYSQNQYGEQSWAPQQPQSQLQFAGSENVPYDDGYNQEQRHRQHESSRTDYHRTKQSQSPSADREYRDYKDSEVAYDQYHNRDGDDRRYRDQRVGRSSYRQSKERDSRRARSRSRDTTPRRERRPHSPPAARSTSRTSSHSGPPSPTSRTAHYSPSYTPPLPDERDRKTKDRESESGKVSPKNKAIDSCRSDDKREVSSPKPSEGSDIESRYGDGFEEILSEEEGMFEVDEVIDMGDEDYEGDEIWNYMSNFNPYQYEIPKLKYFSHPKLSRYLKIKKSTANTEDTLPESSVKILEIIKQDGENCNNEKFVENIESLTDLISPGLISLELNPKHKDVIDVVIRWVCQALDYGKALSQPQSIYKIRHLKSGINLALALFACDCNIVRKLCDLKVPNLILELFTKEHMALSIKLLIIKALDVLTNSHLGISYVCKVDGNERQNQSSCYQKLMKLTLTKQLTRTMVAITALMKKIHLYELLNKLNSVIDKMIKVNYSDDNSKPESESKINENDIDDIMIALNQTTRMLSAAHLLISQPSRSFPLKRPYEFSKTTDDLYCGIYSMFDSCKLLECVSVLLTSSVTCAHSGINRSARDLLHRLLSTQHGMVYVSSHPSTMIIVVRSLLQISADDVSVEDSAGQQLGLQISYCLYILNLVDSLMAFHSKGVSTDAIDKAEVLNLLRNLYSMVFLPVGRSALVNVISQDKNLLCILPFLESTGNEELDGKLHRSVSHLYAVDLLLLVLQHSNSVRMMQEFQPRLLCLSVDESSAKANEIARWLSPLKNIKNYSSSDVEQLMTTVKDHSEEVNTPSPEFLTSVRILQFLCVPPDCPVHDDERREELKYKHAVIQVFANDGLSLFLSFLQKSCEANINITSDTSHLVASHGGVLISAILPVCNLIKSMLSYLISCRTTEFKDLTALPTLLQVYNFLSMMPTSSPNLNDSQKALKVIIEILLSYTQPIPGGTEESDDALCKSLWTQMITEVLNFVQTSPLTFVTGLNILSELLPVPLPIQTREALTQEEITKAINIRKLWCAHLHPLSDNIHQLINTFCGSSCQVLQHALKRVCLQLADLAAPTAITVVKAMLSALVECFSSKSEINNDETSDSNINDQITRILNILVYLVANPPIKVTMLHLLSTSYKSEDKSTDLLLQMLNILTTSSNKQSYIQVQECILSILQSVSDSEITLMSSDTGLSVQEQLSNSVPPKEQLCQIFAASVSLLGQERQDLSNNYTLLLLTIRTMLLLTEHDYGFYHLKTAFEEDGEAINVLLKQLSSYLGKEMTEFIAIMSTLLELLRQLTSVDDEITTVVMPRTVCMSIAELATLLKWKKRLDDGEDDVEVHPLLFIEKQIATCVSDEDGLDALQESVTLLIQLLNEACFKSDDEEDKDCCSEPLLPPPETLSNQFSARATFMIADSDDDRLTASYWLCQPSPDDTEFDPEQMVELDLMEVADKFCPGLDLKATLEKAYLPKDRVKSTNESSDKSAQRSTLSRSVNRKKYQPFLYPGKRDFAHGGSRGRGFNRGGMGRLNDPFRSRPPNTSRPPSMHVDDFVALENNGSSNSNNASDAKRNSKENNRGGRTWGLDNRHQFSGSSNRGRFFNQSSYNRRDSGRGNAATRGNSRGGGLRGQRGGKPGGVSARNFSRQSYDSRQSTPRSRDSYSIGWTKVRSSGAPPYWSENRNRFGSVNNGRGRREVNVRHARNTTR